MALAFWLVAAPLGLVLYAYAGYPLLLRALAAGSRARGYPTEDPPEWPSLSVSLPAYNEEASIGATLDALLAADYPRDRLQILVVSDASTDRTDEIVRSYAGRGVELARQPERRGKTAAEGAAAARLRGGIVVNMDATIRVLPGSLKALVRPFQDPRIGLASGRDVSVPASPTESGATTGESGYVGYEMWVRSLETRLGSIVGASGCFYAIRRELHRTPLRDELSRDFAAALVCRRADYRAVSVDQAVALVPRTGSLRGEYRRKLRTMERGLLTLWHFRDLLNPLRYGRFAWMLASHKLCRWLVPATVPLALAGLAVLSVGSPVAAVALVACVLAAGLAALTALRWPEGRPLPRPVSFVAYGVMANAAGIAAWLRAARGQRRPTWEPTRRVPASSSRPGVSSGDEASEPGEPTAPTG